MSALDLPILAEAARQERDRRAASYPVRLQAMLPGTADHAAQLLALTVDYQCWVAIAEWLERARFAGFYGGPEEHQRDAPWIGWPQLEEAAARALASVDAKIAKFEAQRDAASSESGLSATPDRERVAPAVAARHARRARLNAIHRKVQLRRQLIDSLNAELRTRARARSATVGVDGPGDKKLAAA